MGVELIDRLRAMVSDDAKAIVCKDRTTREMCSDISCAATELADLRRKLDVMREAVRAFLAKHDECQPHITDAFVHRELRCGPYTGPSYADELAALRTAYTTIGDDA